MNYKDKAFEDLLDACRLLKSPDANDATLKIIERVEEIDKLSLEKAKVNLANDILTDKAFNKYPVKSFFNVIFNAAIFINLVFFAFLFAMVMFF